MMHKTRCENREKKENEEEGGEKTSSSDVSTRRVRRGKEIVGIVVEVVDIFGVINGCGVERRMRSRRRRQKNFFLPFFWPFFLPFFCLWCRERRGRRRGKG